MKKQKDPQADGPKIAVVAEKAKKAKELKVKTPLGTLIAYASTDPMNPGIFIDIKRKGSDYQLNLSGTECQIPEDEERPRVLVTHVWGDGQQEDPTHDEAHVGVEEAFAYAEECRKRRTGYSRATVWSVGMACIRPVAPVSLYMRRENAAAGGMEPLSATATYADYAIPKVRTFHRAAFVADGTIVAATDWHDDVDAMRAEATTMERKGVPAFDEIVEQTGRIAD